MIKSTQRLKKIDINIDGDKESFYFTDMTGKERQKILDVSLKTKIEVGTDKVERTINYHDEESIRVYTIVFLAKDENGNKLFNLGDISKVSKIAYKYQAALASVMSGVDIDSLIDEGLESLKKTQN